MTTDSSLLAAIDLGSNSFHMVVAREEHGELRIVDKEKEMVRLGAGLLEDGTLSDEAQERALACLERFGQRLRHIQPGRLRAVGTNTLRASGDRSFVNKAEQALGHHIAVVSGIEEARLVYLGAAHSLAHLEAQRLVVDIGGGSTELVIGQYYDSMLLDSLYMGCVNFSQRFFNGDKISAKRFKQARTQALLELRPVIQRYRQMGWTEAVGTSGTIRAVRDVVQTAGWTDEGIGADALQKLVDRIIETGSVTDLPGLNERRVPVFAGGVAILKAVFDALHIEHMRVADGALREGVLWDLLGRLQNEDIRDTSVAALAQRSGADTEQAERVVGTALGLLEQIAAAWGLTEPRMQRMLRWAAQLHEIGMTVAYSQYQKHGAYILRHANLSGFSRQQQEVIAALVGAHRRKLKLCEFDALPNRWQEPARYLAILLRLAVALNRGRSDNSRPSPVIRVDGKTVKLKLPTDWLNRHPLTRADLDAECDYLAKAGFNLKLKEIASDA